MERSPPSSLEGPREKLDAPKGSSSPSSLGRTRGRPINDDLAALPNRERARELLLASTMSLREDQKDKLRRSVGMTLNTRSLSSSKISRLQQNSRRSSVLNPFPPDSQDYQSPYRRLRTFVAPPELTPSDYPSWVPDEMSPRCLLCGFEFTLTKRRHHCRMCGNVFCSECSRTKIQMPSLYGLEPVRACYSCFEKVKVRVSISEQRLLARLGHSSADEIIFKKPLQLSPEKNTNLISALDSRISCSFDWIPARLIIRIFSFVPERDLLQRVPRVCRSFHALVRSDRLWKPICLRRFPQVDRYRIFSNPSVDQQQQPPPPSIRWREKFTQSCRYSLQCTAQVVQSDVLMIRIFSFLTNDLASLMSVEATCSRFRRLLLCQNAREDGESPQSSIWQRSCWTFFGSGSCGRKFQSTDKVPLYCLYPFLSCVQDRLSTASDSYRSKEICWKLHFQLLVFLCNRYSLSPVDVADSGMNVLSKCIVMSCFEPSFSTITASGNGFFTPLGDGEIPSTDDLITTILHQEIRRKQLRSASSAAKELLGNGIPLALRALEFQHHLSLGGQSLIDLNSIESWADSCPTSNQEKRRQRRRLWQDWGFSPLHLAVFYDDFDVAQWLLDRGLDLHQRTALFGLTPLLLALSRPPPSLSMVRLLLDRGADVTAPEARVPCRSPLQLALASSLGASTLEDTLEIVDLLLKKHPDLTYTDLEGCSAFMTLFGLVEREDGQRAAILELLLAHVRRHYSKDEVVMLLQLQEPLFGWNVTTFAAAASESEDDKCLKLVSDQELSLAPFFRDVFGLSSFDYMRVTGAVKRKIGRGGLWKCGIL